jgi:chemotaxis signal transduction protein
LAERDSDVTSDVKDAGPVEEMRVCLFTIGDDAYAMPVELLTEVIIPQKIFPVPTTPSHVLGVINLRGNIVPLVDIRYALSLPPSVSAVSQIAVVRFGSTTVGIAVDSVSEVTSVPVDSVLTIPSDFGTQAGRNRSRFFKGIIQRDSGLAALLNIDRLIEEIRLS